MIMIRSRRLPVRDETDNGEMAEKEKEPEGSLLLLNYELETAEIYGTSMTSVVSDTPGTVTSPPD